MAEVADLWVTLRAETAPFRRGMSEAAATGESFTARMGGIGGVMTKLGKATTAVGIGVAVASVKMASDFQSATVRLVTSAGETNDHLDLVRKGLLSMAGEVGVSATDLAKSMYYVEAAGYHAGDGLTVLKAAAQGAAAEGADTTTVAQALTDVLKDYHLQASAAGDITSKMITAVAHGKVNLQDFSAAFANIVPTASAAGISFNDVGAALAEMTNHGFTAQRASQNLAQALRSLLNPTKPMYDAFKQFGVSSDELKAKLHGPNGLTDAMEYLSQAATKAGREGTPEFAAALKRLMGTAPGANAALTTVGANFKDTSDTIRAMGGATTDAQGKVKGFAEVQQTLGQRVKQLRAGFDSLLIQLGTGLIPIVTAAIGFFTQHRTAAEALAVAIGVVLAGAVVKFATGAVLGAVTGVKDIGTGLASAGRAVRAFATSERVAAAAARVMAVAQAALNLVLDANPVVLIILAVMALVGALVYAYTHFAWFRAAVQTAFHAITAAVSYVIDFVRAHWQLLLILLLGPVGLAIVGLVRYWSQIRSAVTTAVSFVVGFVKAHWPLLLALLTGPVGIAALLIVRYWKDIADGFAAAYHAVVGVANSLVSWVSALPGRILNALAPLGGRLWAWAVNAFTRATSGATSSGSGLLSWVSGLPHRILASLGNTGSLLWSSGANLINGLVDGIYAESGRLYSYVRNLASSVSSAFSSVLHIFSPSRVFMAHGTNIVAGLVQSLRAGARAVVGASRGLATASLDGFGSPAAAVSITGGLRSATGGGGGPGSGPVVINVTVQGSVLSEHDLRDVIERQMLRLGMRSSTSYTPYKR
ncbi:phage tail tape measure protein [Streptomyces sp. NPDC002537]